MLASAAQSSFAHGKRSEGEGCGQSYRSQLRDCSILSECQSFLRGGLSAAFNIRDPCTNYSSKHGELVLLGYAAILRAKALGAIDSAQLTLQKVNSASA